MIFAKTAAVPVFHAPIDLAGQGRVLVAETTGWLADNSLRILIAVGMATLIVVLLLGAKDLVRRLCREDEGPVGWRTIFARVAAKTSFWFLLLVAARLVDGYAEAPPLLDKTIGFLFTIGCTFQAAIWARELVLGFVEHRAGISDHDHSSLGSAMGIIRILVTFSLFAVALIVVLGNLGVNVTGLVAGLGIGGIAIGLAAQGIFADLFAALAILFDRPFHLGDMISYGDSMGTVEGIGLKSTRIRAVTGELRVISNKNLLDKEILNVSGRDHIRIGFTLSVAYETAPETLARIPDMLKEMVEAEGAKTARAGFETFGSSALCYALQFDVPGHDWPKAHATRDRLVITIIQRFAKEGIAFAYPTQTTLTAAPGGRLIMPYPEPRLDGQRDPVGNGRAVNRTGANSPVA